MGLEETYLDEGLENLLQAAAGGNCKVLEWGNVTINRMSHTSTFKYYVIRSRDYWNLPKTRLGWDEGISSNGREGTLLGSAFLLSQNLFTLPQVFFPLTRGLRE